MCDSESLSPTVHTGGQGPSAQGQQFLLFAPYPISFLHTPFFIVLILIQGLPQQGSRPLLATLTQVVPAKNTVLHAEL